MTPSRFFAASYAEARGRFRDAATAAGARLTAYDHPLSGPDGEALATDVAQFGPADARRALVLSSATHGIEGYCGSGCQVGFLETGLAKTLPADTGLLLVHAHNPHGFAHGRRVTEDNIDLNRNFIDFAAGLPENPAYDEVHDWLVPADWDGPAREAAEARIAAYIAEHGQFAWQAAVTGGQYRHADGLFYGGQGPSWSRRTIEALAAAHLGDCRAVGLIDFHTGLGPRGHGEIIGIGAPGSPMLDRAREWYGDEVRSPEAGDSVSAVVTGTVEQGYEAALPSAAVTGVAIEYGTLPPTEVLTALRADNWLHLHGDPASAQGREIGQQMRAAFYGEDETWKDMVWERARDVVARALAGLAAG